MAQTPNTITYTLKGKLFIALDNFDGDAIELGDVELPITVAVGTTQQGIQYPPGVRGGQTPAARPATGERGNNPQFMDH